jgi:hypothetical protein
MIRPNKYRRLKSGGNRKYRHRHGRAPAAENHHRIAITGNRLTESDIPGLPDVPRRESM